MTSILWNTAQNTEEKEKKSGGELWWSQLCNSATLLPRKDTDHQPETIGLVPHTHFYYRCKYLFASLKQIRNIKLKEMVDGKERERKKGGKTVLQTGILVRSLKWRQPVHREELEKLKSNNRTYLLPFSGERSLSCFKSRQRHQFLKHSKIIGILHVVSLEG